MREEVSLRADGDLRAKRNGFLSGRGQRLSVSPNLCRRIGSVYLEAATVIGTRFHFDSSQVLIAKSASFLCHFFTLREQSDKQKTLAGNQG